MTEEPQSEIVGISDAGLVLQIDGREELALWSAISTVRAVLALVDRTSDQRIPVLIVAIMAGADERVFVIGESEPLWQPLVSTLPEVLPGTPTIEIWGAELAASGKAVLFERSGGLQ
ncbi:hypothetical protein HHL08_23640 [Sphingobium sp. AR-3-1]|uniref:Uncharacterized protein n=1 Tax=Sphingobium psychrophilum TaxID=2728834 RepID=A0A7X9X062_9SPHN|nr:hypothetical protein [Sphingobium psychrophilum]NML13084.1 hypothetical protein [Sphingobium psychrophilum]